MRRPERELLEVVLDGLDLAVVADLVAEAEERILDLAAHLRDRVELAERRARSPGSVTSTTSCVSAPVELGAVERGLPFRDRGLEPARMPLSSMPLSRSRTPRSACASSLLRPR